MEWPQGTMKTTDETSIDSDFYIYRVMSPSKGPTFATGPPQPLPAPRSQFKTILASDLRKHQCVKSYYITIHMKTFAVEKPRRQRHSQKLIDRLPRHEINKSIIDNERYKNRHRHGNHILRITVTGWCGCV
ncbi:hypothetical protein Q1695_004648 [Nippostrongylus brasiliensis]|nr:hypothetical protein Q1695_004648 [Nippostrongylus brasiliensis]